MPVKVVNNLSKFITQNTEVLDLALSRMGDDFVTLAKVKMPRKTQNMENHTQHIKIEDLKHVVAIDVPYAAYQEAGQRIDGTRVVKNYTTPGTGKDFIKDSDKKLKKDSINYIKQAVQLIKVS